MARKIYHAISYAVLKIVEEINKSHALEWMYHFVVNDNGLFNLLQQLHFEYAAQKRKQAKSDLLNQLKRTNDNFRKSFNIYQTNGSYI